MSSISFVSVVLILVSKGVDIIITPSHIPLLLRMELPHTARDRSLPLPLPVTTKKRPAGPHSKPSMYGEIFKIGVVNNAVLVVVEGGKYLVNVSRLRREFQRLEPLLDLVWIRKDEG